MALGGPSSPHRLVGGPLGRKGTAGQVLQHPIGSRARGQAGREDEELVASDAGHDVLFAHHLAQELGQLLQHGIALEVAVGVVHFLEIVHIHHDEGTGAVLVGQGRLDAIEGRRAIVESREPVALGLAAELALAQRCLVGVKQPPHMALGTAVLVVEHHGLIAVPHRLIMGAGRRGLEIYEGVLADLLHERREIVGRDGQLAGLLAPTMHDEIALLGSAAEAALKIAVDMGLPRGALDVEEHVVGKGRDDLEPLVGPAQLLLVVHLVGNVHHRHVEPAPSFSVFHKLAPVLNPAQGPIGAADAVAHVVFVACRGLLRNLALHAIAILLINEPRERVARQRLEGRNVFAAEQVQQAGIGAVEGVVPLGGIAEHAAGETIEEFLGYLGFGRGHIGLGLGGLCGLMGLGDLQAPLSVVTFFPMMEDVAERNHANSLVLGLRASVEIAAIAARDILA